jgi:predicted nuclease of predicted toxin-antitoxin system
VKLLADECFDAFVVAGLRADGYDVLYVIEAARGAEDDAILQMGVEQERILLTEDKDFGELVVRLRLPAHGVLLLRMNPADSTTKLARLREVLQDQTHRLVGFFVVVDEDKTRFRPLRPPTP